MDQIVTVAQVKADVANSVAKNMAANVAEALGSLLDGKGAALDEKLERRFNSLRHKLYLRYIMVDYEVLLSRNYRNDVYAELMEGGKL